MPREQHCLHELAFGELLVRSCRWVILQTCTHDTTNLVCKPLPKGFSAHGISCPRSPLMMQVTLGIANFP